MGRDPLTRNCWGRGFGSGPGFRHSVVGFRKPAISGRGRSREYVKHHGRSRRPLVTDYDI